MTLSQLIERHNGETLLCFNGRSYDVLDIEFPTRADGQHFAYAARQDYWRNEIFVVDHITDSADGTSLYSIHVNNI